MTTESRTDEDVTPDDRPLTPAERARLAGLWAAMDEVGARGDAMRAELLRTGASMDRT